MSTETAPKRQRKPKRNFARIVDMAILKCKAREDYFNAIASLDLNEVVKAGLLGRVEAYNDIREMLEGAK